MRTADLHIHTLASDGAFSVEEVLTEGRRLGLSAIGITDHDSVESLPKAVALSPLFGLEVVPGIEISIDLADAEMHLLGYCIDYLDSSFQEELTWLRKARRERARKMVERLGEMGFPLDRDKLLLEEKNASVGRLHIAQALLQAGYVSSVQEAFLKYIGRKGPAYVPKLKLSKKRALAMILELGGVPILAHPGNLKRDELIPELIDLGLAGLEVYYPSHTKAETEHYQKMARRYGLLVTGGSDCHGANKSEVLMGQIRIPYELVQKVKEQALQSAERRGRH